MLPPRIFTLALLTLLAACGQSAVGNGSDPLAFSAPGSEIQLTRNLDIPAGETRVSFSGENNPQTGARLLQPQLRPGGPGELRQQVRTVSRDLFVIGRLTTGRDPVVHMGATKPPTDVSAPQWFV